MPFRGQTLCQSNDRKEVSPRCSGSQKDGCYRRQSIPNEESRANEPFEMCRWAQTLPLLTCERQRGPAQPQTLTVRADPWGG
jgi:hypothetical protein